MENISPCGEEGKKSMLRCLSRKNEVYRKSRVHVNYNLTCNFTTHGCFYVVDCYPIGNAGYECKDVDHFVNYLGFCCNFVC